MDLMLKDKVALVTGAGGGGFGTTICATLASEGAHVVANDIDPSWAERVAGQCRALGVRSIATNADVTNLHHCHEMVHRALEEFARIDILVTIPAYSAGKRFMEQEEAEWHKIMDVTFWGVAYACRSVLPTMVRQNSGSIVCIGSDAGKVGEATMVLYGCAKAAISNLAKGLSKEVSRHGVRVNVVNPGTTKTPTGMRFVNQVGEDKLKRFYPLGRLGVPQDIANAIVFLASDRASWVTGQTLSVSGGYSMA
mgnify:CR=1 FL=1